MSPFRNYIASLGCLLLACGPTAMVMAAPIQPFDAVVQAKPGEDAYARSGPGVVSQYPTLKLNSGDKVRVLRKDPGGWYMIEPPAGSFSWIIAKYVQRTGPQQGTVIQNNVVVRVGAANSTQRDIEQVRLSKGDQVQIIAEQVLESDKGRELWLKIKPPRGEYRWVKGSFLVELNPDGSPKVITKHSTAKVADEANDSNKSLATAVSPTQPRSNSKAPAFQRDPQSQTGDAPLYGHAPGRASNPDPFEEPTEAEGSGTPQSEEKAIREDLVLLDEELRQILDKPPVSWDLSTQLEDLKTLQEMSADMAVGADVERRLKRVIGLQKIHEDALAMAPRNTTRQSSGGSMSAARQATIQSSVPSNPSAPPPGNSPGNSSSSSRPTNSRFEGAGIVYRLDRAPQGMPNYVIAAPDGRILCYLDHDPSIDLQRYVGQSVGLNGRRYYEPRLRADRMLVQKITSVRLTQ